MTLNNTNKLWKRIDKVFPGVSEFIDPAEILGLSKKEQQALNFVAGLYLLDEKDKNCKSGKRKVFTKKTKLSILKAQGYRCKSCKKKLEEADFDHVDGDRTNNSISNCQALCPNCHAKKTRKK